MLGYSHQVCPWPIHFGIHEGIPLTHWKGKSKTILTCISCSGHEHSMLNGRGPEVGSRVGQHT